MRPSHLCAAIAATFLCVQPTLAAEPLEKISPEALRSDFAAMYAGLKSGAFDLNAFTPREVMDAAYARELKGLDAPLSKVDAEIRFQRFAALAHQGHARVDFPYGAWSARMADGGRAFPITLRIVDGRAYVGRDGSGLAEISPGDELLALNGASTQEWLKRTGRNASAETDYMTGSLLEYDFAPYLWAELGDVAVFDLRLRKADGRTVDLSVPARTQAEIDAALAAEPPALDLRKPPREHRILEGGVGYLRPGPFYNAEAKTGAEAWDVSGFAAFVDEAFEAFTAARVDRLIIDLRGNPGGDNLFSDRMVAWFADKPFRFFSTFRVKVSAEAERANADRLAHDAEAAGPVSRQYARMYAGAKPGDVVDFELPMTPPRTGRRFAGQVFVLIDRQSYSNAVSVAALVQDYGFGTILGEETSDVAAAYGAMEQFVLPASGIRVRFPKAHIVRPSGDATPRGVRPDIAIVTPIVQGPDDPVLQEAVRIARSAPAKR